MRRQAGQRLHPWERAPSWVSKPCNFSHETKFYRRLLANLVVRDTGVGSLSRHAELK